MSVPVKETPEQQAASAEAKRVRLQVAETVAKRNAIPDPKPVFGDPFIFKFEKFMNTNFAGLWRLEVLDKYGRVVETITDADALPNILEAIGNIFANKGY